MQERTTAALRAVILGTTLAATLPAVAAAHGGTTIAEGSSSGVTILVQGTDAVTPGGQPAADVSTVLAGPGSGDGARVTYYVRPKGGKSIRINTERDEGGTFHEEVSTVDRGDWREWDVSAIVMLSDGKRLRVSNAGANAPGPDPAQASEPGAETAAPSSPTATEADPAPTTPTAEPDTPAEDAEAQAVQDVSGEDEGAPSWALPSVAVIAVLGLLGLAVLRRRHGGPEAGEDWDSGSGD